ncbi:MAG: glucosamine-6-phosphate deaminase, partial [Acidimicrobiales bacterium]
MVITSGPDEAADIAAGAVERLLASNPDAVLGLATGSSPVPTYRLLIERHRSGRLSFARSRAFLLDEYVGLPADHAESYRAFIDREFTGQVDFGPEAVDGPDGTVGLDRAGDDLATAGQTYEEQISRAGGIDLQLLGIGGDGHIGFNEPVSSLGSRTRLKTLTEETRADNARFFGGDIDAVPRHVITQGIGTILEARHLVMIATGESKAGPIARAVEGPLTAMVPA